MTELKSEQEVARLNALYDYEILDTLPEAVFDNLARLAAHVCRTPIALITFIDRNRQWFKARFGWTISELPRNVGFCPHVILQRGLLIVPDTCQDSRFANDPLVTCEPLIQFYAGVPLFTLTGQAIGTLCVMDQRSRKLSHKQIEQLQTLRRQVVSHLESRQQLMYAAHVTTTSQRMKGRLKHLNPSLRAIFNSNLQAVVFINWEYKVQTFNKTANDWVKRIYGRVIKEGNSVYDFVEQKDLDKFNSHLDTAFQGELVRIEHLLKGFENTEHWFEFNFSPVFDNQEQVIGVCFVAINIDKEKTALDALSKSEERFRSLVQNSSDIITVLAADGTIVYVSPSVERILGYKATDLVGKNIVAYIHPEDVPIYQAEFADILNQPAMTVLSEMRALHKDGTWIFVETASNNQLNNGSVKGIVLNSRDITDRKLTEHKIQESLKEKEVLLKEIHHRVKNNLQTISSLLNLQSEYIKDQNALNSFKESQSRIKSIALLHEKLYQSNNSLQINFAEYVQKLAVNLFCVYGVDSSTISLKVHVEDVLLDSDTAIPCALIINELISNCIKYAFPPGKYGEICILLVRVPNQDNKLILTVRDNGVGFPKHIDLCNPESLGLQLVNTLVAQIKGTVELNCNGITEFNIEFLVTPTQ